MKQLIIISSIALLLLSAALVFIAVRRKKDFVKNRGLSPTETEEIIQKSTRFGSEAERQNAHKALRTGMYVPQEIADYHIPFYLILAEMWRIAQDKNWYDSIQKDAVQKQLPIMQLLAEAAAWNLHEHRYPGSIRSYELRHKKTA